MARVGILGAGGIGTVHARGYAQIPNAQIVAVADAVPAAADKLAAAHGARAYHSIPSLLADSQVDLVDVCLPTHLHAEAVIAAARAGKHVLCEKPIALGLEEVDRMIEAVERAGVQAMIAQVVRFMPHYQAIKDLFRRGELGRPLSAAAARLGDPPGWSSWFADPAKSGGAILDLHVHDLDYLYWLFGAPRRVYASGLKSALGAWDQVLTVLDYGEFKASAEGSTMMPRGFPFTATIRLLGDKGCAQYPAGGPQAVDRGAAATAGGQLVVYRPGQPPEYPTLAAKDPYMAEVEYFVGCVERGRPPTIATLAEARQVLAIALAARRSLESGEVIEL